MKILYHIMLNYLGVLNGGYGPIELANTSGIMVVEEKKLATVGEVLVYGSSDLIDE